MPSSRFLIASNTLSTSAASVTFSSIPGTYTDLVLRASMRSDSAFTSSTFYLRLNNDTSSTESWTRLLGNGSAASSDRSSGTQFELTGMLPDASATSNTFNNVEVYIPNYANTTTNKPVSFFSARENNTTAANIAVHAGLYVSTSAVSRLDFSAFAGNFVTGSSFWLYGIKNS